MKKLIQVITVVVLSILVSSCFWEENTKIIISTSSTPDYITSIKVVVTADDMETFEKTFSKDAAVLEVNIPSGNERYFQVFGYVEDGNVMAVKSFRGTATQDLVAGESVNLDMQMVPYETKFLIPDAWGGQSGSTKVGQIDNMSGLNYITQSTPYNPLDIDLDHRGNIYIVAQELYASSIAQNSIFKINSINETISSTVVTGTDLYFRAIAIDRKRKIIYYSSSLNIFYINYEKITGSTQLTLSNENTISGLSINNDGILFISGSSDIIIYDTNKMQVIKTITIDGIEVVIKDIMVKDNKVYAATNAMSVGNIIEFEFNGETLTQTGNYNTDITLPQKFIGTTNPEIIFIDENNDFSNPINRIISIDNINGDNRKVKNFDDDILKLFINIPSEPM